jgi:hypothetical protein
MVASRRACRRFAAATAIAALLLYPYYPKMQDRTDSAGDAFGAFLTLCLIFGGLGPVVTLSFLCRAESGRETTTRFDLTRPDTSLDDYVPLDPLPLF